MRTRANAGKAAIAFLVVLVAGLGGACAKSQTGPAEEDAAFGQTVQLVEGNAAVYWNEVARQLVIRSSANPYQAVRGFAIASIAQYNATVAVDPPQRNRRAFLRAAITRASVDALSYIHPTEAAHLEALGAEFIAAGWQPGDRQEDRAAGNAAGAGAAIAIIERAKTDNFFAPWMGVIPAGPGIWFSSSVPPAPPILPMLGQAKPFLLRSGDQFRPAPPPAWGSAGFLEALDEVRRIASTRTREQDSIAKFWAFPTGTYSPPGYWNDEAARLALRHRLGERRTAHLFALMNMVGADALIAGHDAKYAYWLMRPSQADPSIQPAIGLPNFPSYFSNHGAVSGGMARIIGAWFPSERRRLDQLANQAAMSRLYGGIHFRFDNDTGLMVGRRIANWALDHDTRDGKPFVLR